MRNSVDIRSIQVWLGHTNLNTTAIYLHTNEEQVRHIGEKASFGGASHPMAGAEVQPPAESPPNRADYHRRRRATR